MRCQPCQLAEMNAAALFLSYEPHGINSPRPPTLPRIIALDDPIEYARSAEPQLRRGAAGVRHGRELRPGGVPRSLRHPEPGRQVPHSCDRHGQDRRDRRQGVGGAAAGSVREVRVEEVEGDGGNQEQSDGSEGRLRVEKGTWEVRRLFVFRRPGSLFHFVNIGGAPRYDEFMTILPLGLFLGGQTTVNECALLVPNRHTLVEEQATHEQQHPIPL